jgi:hypothetical protein
MAVFPRVARIVSCPGLWEVTETWTKGMHAVAGYIIIGAYKDVGRDNPSIKDYASLVVP